MKSNIKGEFENYKRIFDAINDAVFFHDGETGEIIAVNQAMCRMYGYTEQEALKLSVGDLSSGEDPFTQKRAMELLEETTPTKPQRFEWHARRNNGELFWVEVTINYTKLNDTYFLLVIVRDIDSQKHMIKQLTRSEEKFSAAFRTAADMLSISRVDNSVFIDVNQSSLAVLGYPPGELIGKSALELGIWPYPDERKMLTDQLRERGYFRNEEVHLQQKDGTIIDVSITSNLLPLTDQMYVLSNVRDISQLAKANKQIEKLNQELEERIKQRTAQLEAANQELEAFSYSVSHDLRAPLRAIEGFSRAVIEDIGDDVGEGVLDNLAKILNASLKMDKLIVGLLDLSKLDRTKLHPEVVQLERMARQIFSESIEKGTGGEINLEVQKGLSAFGDPVLLRILLTNLISNAIKYSKPRSECKIKIGTTKVDGQTQYYVKDNGTGFDQAFALRIFEPFQRLHAEGEYEGIGIGLALARRIVRHHGGRIWVESEPGAGTTFYFTINLKAE